ncbi:Tar ligand binding domain-containing protein, partial [Enterobacter ludwigii]|uniref:Tar ligand binding domain-containing protein n=2 Tax=Enterobacter TaxID=547 RepID=UPI0007C63DC1
MLNRIRISTTLFLILILCGVLQVGSNGLSFWAFRDGYQNLQEVEASNQQRAAVAQTRAVLLQASTALNKAGTLTALSYPPDDIKALMVTARDSLKLADAQFNAFAAQDAGSAEVKALKVAMKKRFDQWHSDLDHQATWLENNQLSDFMTAPVQASQAAFDASFNAWQQNINQFVQRAGNDSCKNYHMSGVIFAVVVILAVLLTGGALYWSRRMIVQPLAIVSSHFDSIAKGNLARPVAVYGKNEISAIFASLKAMQGALRETVSDVRQGSYAMHTGISEIAAGNNDLSSRTEQQAASLAQTAASMEQLTATVSQNADNARQASDLSRQAAMTAKKGGDQASHVASTMQDIAASSQKIGDIISVIDGIA